MAICIYLLENIRSILTHFDRIFPIPTDIKNIVRTYLYNVRFLTYIPVAFKPRIRRMAFKVDYHNSFIVIHYLLEFVEAVLKLNSYIL